MSKLFSFIALRDDETEIKGSYHYRAEEQARPWGDYPYPGSPAEVDLLDVRDAEGNNVTLTLREHGRIEIEVLEQHEDEERDPDMWRDDLIEDARLRAEERYADDFIDF